MTFDIWWIGFFLLILGLLALDIVVFNRKAHEVQLREALLWSAFWISIAMIFNVVIYFTRGGESAVQYFTAYIIEKSLSVDNLFVFLMLFTYFQVPAKYQHKVLFWGIVGALVMRMLFIFAGIALISKFHWMLYIFGAILIYSGLKMLKSADVEVHPETNPVLKLFRRIMPVTSEYHGASFFVWQNSRWYATPLIVVLLVIETTDVVFAVDSVPAVLAISQDAFIVYTSNIMAILGLRALYFALAGVMRVFRHLHYGLAAILVFVGFKMLAADFIHIPIALSLGVIGSILAISIAASLLLPARTEEKS
ncbi:MAG: TerC family protein [Bacteroidota bacterium]